MLCKIIEGFLSVLYFPSAIFHLENFVNAVDTVHCYNLLSKFSDRSHPRFLLDSTSHIRGWQT